MLNAAEVQSWSWRFIRVVIAVFLGVIAFGIAVEPLVDEARRVDEWPATGPTKEHWNRAYAITGTPEADTKVSLTVTATDVSGTVRVTLPRHKIIELQRTIAAVVDRVSWQSVLDPFAARVQVGDATMRGEALSFLLNEGEARGVVEIRLPRTMLPAKKQRVHLLIHEAWRIESNRIVVRIATRGAQIIATGHQPTSQSDDQTVFAATNRMAFIILRIPTARPSDTSVRRRISDVVSHSAYDRVLDPLVSGLMASIPFILLIVVMRRHVDRLLSIRPDADVRQKEKVIATATAFVALLIGTGIMNAALDLYFGPAAPLSNLIADACADALLQPGGAAALGAAFVACYWPIYARGASASSRAASSRVRIVLWIALLLTVAATGVIAIRSCTAAGQAFGKPITDLAAASAIVGIIAAIVAIATVSAELIGLRSALFHAMATVGVALAFLMTDVALNLNNVAAFALMALLSVPLIFRVLRLILPHWDARTIFSATLLICALLVIGPLPDYNLWWDAAMTRVPIALASALRLLAVVYLLQLLEEFSLTDHWATLEDDERNAGVALALTLFFLPRQQWLFTIVSLSLGWLLLTRWVFVPRNIVDSGSDASNTIRGVIRFNEAQLALRMMKKVLREKLAKAEMVFHEYERHVRGLESFVDELRDQIEPRGNNAPAAVLSYGSPMNPWPRAVIGARYGLLFAVPWLALLLRDFHAGMAPERGFEWVGAIGTAVQALALWPVLGFFFGYFYPHLRGDTGLSKGLYLFLAVVTPTFAATALAMPSNTQAWTSFSFWALQLFIHCMLLGFFAGDYETLRASGLGWQHLVDVHNLGALTAWGSSLLLAIGVAATTVATTQAGALIMQALQTIVPDLKPP